MIVGSYYAQAYCETVTDDCSEEESLRHQFPELHDPAPNGRRFGPHPADASGENKREAYARLRRRGWKIVVDEDGIERAYCPGCAALGRHKTETGT